MIFFLSAAEQEQSAAMEVFWRLVLSASDPVIDDFFESAAVERAVATATNFHPLALFLVPTKLIVPPDFIFNGSIVGVGGKQWLLQIGNRLR